MTRGMGEFWRGKRVLLTGHTGFKGSWLTIWLGRLGAEVTGVSLPPATDPSLFVLAGVEDRCDSNFHDIREYRQLASLVARTAPQVVIHMAAQPLVRPGYRQPRETFDTNVMGTANLLEALRGLADVKAAIMVTTDKVYFDTGQSRPYAEEDRLGGHDPYSASKAASELVISSYRDSYFRERGVAIASARAGNVIGGGDWSEDRLIPDAIRAWQAGRTLEIRRPQAIRPWQYVLDPLYGYLKLAELLWHEPEMAGAYNFGPLADAGICVRELVEMAMNAYGGGDVRYGDDNAGPHEAAALTLDARKSATELGVSSRVDLPEAVARTVDWYRAVHGGADAGEFCLAEIAHFEEGQ